MRQIPVITKNLLIINLLCYMAGLVLTGYGLDVNNIFGLHYFQGDDFHLFQFITYMFMHGSFSHVFFNMFALWMFGSVIERDFGQKRFLIYYMVCGLGAAFCQEVSQMVSTYIAVREHMPTASFIDMLTQLHIARTVPTVGASGAVYGILLAFGMTRPEERMFVFPLPIPIKAKWFVCGYVVIELFMALTQPGDGVAHVAHIGGMFFGWLLIRHWRRHSYSFNGWDGYEVNSSGPGLLERISQWFRNLTGSRGTKGPQQRQQRSGNSHSQDWDYNAQQREREKEIDRILDKIRRSGYTSLTDEEKRKLFEQQ